MKNSITYLYTRKYQQRIILHWLITFLCSMLMTAIGYGQSGNSFKPAPAKHDLAGVAATYNNVNDEEDYEEISITLNVLHIGSIEIPAVIHGRQIYLSVPDLFDFLKIRNMPSADMDSITGYFITPKAKYFIDAVNNKISYQDKIFTLKPADFAHTRTSLYLASDCLGKIFGLECAFDFRSLSVTLTTKIELPAIRELQQEQMRNNISRLKGEKKVDTVIGRSFPLFHVGMADWSLFSSQDNNGNSNTRANLGIGGIVAGGEVDLSLNYNSAEKTDLRQQFYQWKFVNNDHAGLRQVTVGTLFAQSTASVYAPVIGVQFTNTPTTYKKSFGTYTLSNTTEPGWTVELYVNNVLINYSKADASGFYTFEVPMIYGNSVVKLRFYGPFGEESTSEKYISIPFNFIPFRKLEYNVTTGIVEDGEKSRYARAYLNYGLSRHITVGGGMEYLSSVTSGKYMPFVNASFRAGPGLLLSGEYAYGVRTKATLSYRLPSNLQIDVAYTKYAKDQTAINFNYLEEKKIVLSMPLRARHFTAFSRFTLNQFTLPDNIFTNKDIKMKYTSAELLFSAVVSGISSNLTTYAMLSNTANPLVYSNLALTFRLPAGIRITPQVQYEYQSKKCSMLKTEVEKNIFNRGFINVAYEKTLANNNTNTITVGLRYDFSFAQTSFYATKTGHTTTATQAARGSLMYDNKTNYLKAGNQASVGRGGLIILPYLDLNCNGQRDAGEPRAFGLNCSINGGRTDRNDRDTTLRISGLESYADYIIECDKSSFDNVAWQIKQPTIGVTIEPNNFKLVEIPVAVVGEVTGTVYLNNGGDRNGLGQVIVNFYNSNNQIIARTVTESDGYFSFMGLKPGSYTAKVDEKQLQKLQLVSTPSFSFQIKINRDGDVAGGLKFILQSGLAAAETGRKVL